MYSTLYVIAGKRRAPPIFLPMATILRFYLLLGLWFQPRRPTKDEDKQTTKIITQQQNENVQ
jgi:hypothetical protein